MKKILGIILSSGLSSLANESNYPRYLANSKILGTTSKLLQEKRCFKQNTNIFYLIENIRYTCEGETPRRDFRLNLGYLGKIAQTKTVILIRAQKRNKTLVFSMQFHKVLDMRQNLKLWMWHKKNFFKLVFYNKSKLVRTKHETTIEGRESTILFIF